MICDNCGPDSKWELCENNTKCCAICANCKTCLKPGKCGECDEGFSLNNGICVPCDEID